MTEDAAVVTVEESSRSVNEGKAKVLLPPNVFYNPVQEFNRDLTIAIISQIAAENWNKKQNTNQVESTETKTDNVNKRLSSDCDDLKDQSNAIDTQLESGHNRVHLLSGKKYDDGIRILEGLAASGLRSVRFALEIPGVKEVVANDFDSVAYDFIKQNAQVNNVNNIVFPSFMDAAMLMYQSRRYDDRFDVIDLDPYGSPAIFLDAAVQSVSDGGMLCITCTDMAVLCGNATETCHAKYGSTSLKARFCHEMALRILLRSIESRANCYSRFIVPILSISVDFYCRVFVRVYTGQKKVKDSASKLSLVYHCSSCGAFALQPLVVKTATRNDNFKYSVSTGPPVESRCGSCNGRYTLGGPIWSAPIHSKSFVQKVIESVEEGQSCFGTKQRILGILNVICEELENEPLFYDTDHLCTVLHCSAIGFLPMRSALLHRGYSVSLSHANRKSLKTNASSEVIWDVLRCWVKKNPVSCDRLREGSAAATILSKEPSFEADFSIHPDANPPSRKRGLVRWQINPERDWGPKPRAARSKESVEARKLAQDLKCQERKAKRKADNQVELQVAAKAYPCKRFRKGSCTLGSECRYSHSKDLMNTSDDKSSRNQQELSGITDDQI